MCFRFPAVAAALAGLLFCAGANAADSSASLSQVGTIPAQTALPASPSAPRTVVPGAQTPGRPPAATSRGAAVRQPRTPPAAVAGGNPAIPSQTSTVPATGAATIRQDQQAAESQVIQENRNTNAVTPGQFNNIVLTPIQRGSTVLPSVVGGQTAPPPTGGSPVFNTTP